MPKNLFQSDAIRIADSMRPEHLLEAANQTEMLDIADHLRDQLTANNYHPLLKKMNEDNEKFFCSLAWYAIEYMRSKKDKAIINAYPIGIVMPSYEVVDKLDLWKFLN